MLACTIACTMGGAWAADDDAARWQHFPVPPAFQARARALRGSRFFGRFKGIRPQGARVRGQVLAEFLTWWGEQLISLVPPALAARATGGADALVLEAAGEDALSLLRRRGPKETKLGTLRLDEGFAASLARILPSRSGETVLLRVPQGLALEREISLPLAAERDVERVVGYDMDRLTPFSAQEVFWGVEVIARDRARARLAARLTIVPRAGMAAPLERLTALALAPNALEIAGESGARQIRLSHDGGNGGNGRLARFGAPVLAGLALLLLVSPFLRQEMILHNLAGREAQLAPGMREVASLRARINGNGGGDALAAEMKRAGDVLAALAATTEILPDDSYLTDFSIRERKLEMSGLSAAAAKLIAALSEDQRMRNPAFSAPVTRNEAIKLDVFSIHAEWAQ